MIEPFLVKEKNRIFVKLNKELYEKALIEKIGLVEPGSISSISTKKDYYLVELNIDSPEDYLGFLNYLIYYKRK